MSRLDEQLQRLALPASLAALQEAEATGFVRAPVLELAGPGGWSLLAAVWQDVQSELQLPAPAIAINGIDGYQLWFPLAQAVPAAEAAQFLQALRARYLPEVAPARVRMHPGPVLPLAAAPPGERSEGRWSAFVTPDLAAMFAEEAWLDLPPGAEAQADLLARLQCATPQEWQRALELQAAAATVPEPAPAAEPPSAASAPWQDDPRRFLLEVMNDPGVALALRIEAAKALLPAAGGRAHG